MRKLSLLMTVLALIGCFSGCEKFYHGEGPTSGSAGTVPTHSQTQSVAPTVPTTSGSSQQEEQWPTLSQDRKVIIELAWNTSRLRVDSVNKAYFTDMTPDDGHRKNGIRYYGTYVIGEGNDRRAYDILYIPTLDLDVPAMIELGDHRFISRCAFHLYAFEYHIDEEKDRRHVNFYSIRKFYSADDTEVMDMLEKIHDLHNAYETAIFGYSLGIAPEIPEVQDTKWIQSVWLTCTSKHISEAKIAEQYYGNFGGYDIYEYEDGLYQYIAKHSSQTIGPYSFTETRIYRNVLGEEVPMLFELYAIKDGTLKTLKEIYEEGRISDRSLEEIHKLFLERRES